MNQRSFMDVYHQVDSSALKGILQHGLKTQAGGGKGQDPKIRAADVYLDKHRPPKFITAGPSREHNSYALLPYNASMVINITDGSPAPIHDLIVDKNQSLIRLSVDPCRCYVSNLDLYDACKELLENATTERNLLELAQKYWDSIVMLSKYHASSIRRPEVMITYDVEPRDITKV